MKGSDIISLATFKQLIDVKDTSNDDYLKSILDTVFAFANAYTGRDLSYWQGTQTIYVNEPEPPIYQSSMGYMYVKLAHYPVDESQPLNVYLDDIQTNDIIDHLNDNRLFILELPSEKLEIEYAGGYNSDNIPEDLSYAIMQIGAIMWNEKKGTIGLKALRIGAEEIQVLEDEIPARAKIVLNTYREVGI